MYLLTLTHSLSHSDDQNSPASPLVPTEFDIW